VSDIEPFLEGDEWLEAFGSVMVRWPLRPRSTFDENWLTRLVLFNDGVRIDFQDPRDDGQCTYFVCTLIHEPDPV
jgi:aminoglycoside 6-adenylyltransferase